MKKSDDSVKIKNVFLIIFVLITICLCVTLIFYFKINNRNNEEFSLQKDIFRLKAEIKPFNPKNSKINGVVEIKEVSN